ncbi:MAG: MFS transporter [Thermomicrobiales bacterium]|nr:MFS transporter [Thermomicrobiales bacterium]
MITSTSLWRNPDFRSLWTSVVISTYGSLLRGSAMIYAAIFLLHAPPADIGLLRLAELVPAFAAGLVAGVWVDRMRRRPVLIGADLLRAAMLITVPLAAWLGMLSFPHLLLAAAIVSALGVFFDVAYEAFLPSLLPNRRLIEANSKITAGAAVTEALSFSSGGWLVQLLSAPATLAIDAITFVGSAWFIARVRDVETGGSPQAVDAEPPRPFLQEALEGIQATWRQPLLRGMILAAMGINAGFGVFGTSMIYYLNQRVGFDPGVLGMIFAIGGVSSLAGALLAQRISHARLGLAMIGALVLTVIGQAFVPLASEVGLLAVTLLVGQQLLTDGALTLFDINQVSLRQAITPAHLLGRVNACARAAEFGAVLAGTLLATVSSEVLGLRASLWIGVGFTALAVAGLALSPVRDVDHIPASPVEVTP